MTALHSFNSPTRLLSKFQAGCLKQMQAKTNALNTVKAMK